MDPQRGCPKGTSTRTHRVSLHSGQTGAASSRLSSGPPDDLACSNRASTSPSRSISSAIVPPPPQHRLDVAQVAGVCQHRLPKRLGYPLRRVFSFHVLEPLGRHRRDDANVLLVYAKDVWPIPDIPIERRLRLPARERPVRARPRRRHHAPVGRRVHAVTRAAMPPATPAAAARAPPATPAPAPPPARRHPIRAPGRRPALATVTTEGRPCFRCSTKMARSAQRSVVTSVTRSSSGPKIAAGTGTTSTGRLPPPAEPGGLPLATITRAPCGRTGSRTSPACPRTAGAATPTRRAGAWR